jgi:hypothetical protein
MNLLKAIEHAKKEKQSGNIADYWVDNQIIYFRSIDGGVSVWFDQNDWRQS